MKKYIEIGKIFFKAQITYRFEVAMTILFTVTRILFAYMLWSAVFGQHDTVGGFTLHQMLTYYVVSSFLTQLEMSHGVSEELSAGVKRGTFSKFMVIPVNTQGYFLAQTLGRISFYLLFILAATVGWIFLFEVRFVLTNSQPQILAAIILVVLGLVFMIQLNYFLGILAFKFQEISIFLMIKENVVAFLTGVLVPLALLPPGLTSVMRIFPFYYVTYLPSMLLIGKNQEQAVFGIILLSGWLLLLTMVNKLAYHKLRTIYDGVGI
jgi:ABC-2 type transport system permease protein